MAKSQQCSVYNLKLLPCRFHSWPKFKITFVKKSRRKTHYLTILFKYLDIQIFQNSWTLVLSKFFWELSFNKIFALSPINFEFLSWMLVPQNMNGSSFFFQMPADKKSLKIRGPCRTLDLCKNYYSHS